MLSKSLVFKNSIKSSISIYQKIFNLYRVQFFSFLQENQNDNNEVTDNQDREIIKLQINEKIEKFNYNQNNDLSDYNYKIIKEPEEYRTLYLENIPTHWTEEQLKVRLEQLGSLEKVHLIKNSIGESRGRALAIYTKIDHLVESINTFKGKYPTFKPLKIRFYRKYEHSIHKKEKEELSKKKEFENKPSDVLLIKNLPEDLLKDDLNLFISEFKEPIYIAYPRDHEDEFKKIAYVYFKSIEDAETVLKFANLRYVKNKQLYIQFSQKHWDITDFRTRVELGLKLSPEIELFYFRKQIKNFIERLEYLKSIGKNNNEREEIEKLEYLKMRFRKLEYELGLTNKDKPALAGLLGDESSQNLQAKKPRRQIKKQIYFQNDDGGLIIVNNKNKY